MLNQTASVNFYMFYGGTNFGFTAGANDGGPAGYNADITSYDYDAPMDEAGDPTPKYMEIRDAIAKFFPLPDIPVPPRQIKIKLPSVRLTASMALLSTAARRALGNGPRQFRTPPTFETLNQNSGFVLYETNLAPLEKDPSLLSLRGLRDRAQVLIDGVSAIVAKLNTQVIIFFVYVLQKVIGILSRENGIFSLPIGAGTGSILQILVENQGRINFNIADDLKGIIGNVLLNNKPIYSWNATGFPLDDSSKFNYLNRYGQSEQRERTNADHLSSGPVIFKGSFYLNANNIYDTYINTVNWGKVNAKLNHE